METPPPETELLSRYLMDCVIEGDAKEIVGAYEAFVKDLKRHDCRFKGGIMMSPLTSKERAHRES